AGCDQPVAAVVALADDHADRTLACGFRRRPRQAGAGPLHQVQRRDAGLVDRVCVGGAHFPGLPERVEPVRQRHLRIATAAAVERVCVSDTTGRAPSSSARDAAAPLSRTSGAAPVATTSTSRNAHTSSASALATASLAQNRAAR